MGIPLEARSTLEEDKKAALDAIDKVFGNTTVTVEETRAALYELMNRIDSNLDGLGER
jgi:hypothetical protein